MALPLDVELSQLSRTSKPSQSIRFFDLPSEIKIRIYEFALLLDSAIDLHPSNYRDVAPLLDMFLTCQRMHNEAYPVFYGGNTFSMFPTHHRFFDKKHLLARLPQRYCATITTMSLLLGSGWRSPANSWSRIEQLALKDVKSLKLIKIMVDGDSSDFITQNFEREDGFYTPFCDVLLQVILFQAPSIREVEFDACPTVPRHCPLMSVLVTLAKNKGKKVTWGPRRGWGDATAVMKLEQATAALRV